MKRRESVTLLGGSATAVAWPLATRAQQGRMRRVGILVGWDENNPAAKLLLSKSAQRLQELGWTEGNNIRLDVRWAAGNVDRMQVFAKELVGLGPDLILASTTPATAALHRETRTIPIVFCNRLRSGRRRIRRGLVPPRCEYHGVHQPRTDNGWKMARASQGGRAQR
jgi:putative ABC transport system substrate-binding protein